MRPWVFLALALFAAATRAAPAQSDARAAQDCNVLPRMVKAPVLHYPPAAAALNLGKLDVKIVLSIDATGSVTDAKILESSGYDVIDAAAIAGAKAATYRPGMRACHPVPFRVIFIAAFSPAPDSGNHGDFVPPPTFTAPDGWVPDTGPAPGAAFGAWIRGTEHLLVVGSRSVEGQETAESALDAALQSLHVASADAVRSPVSICGRSQAAERATFARTRADGTHVSELLLVAQGNGNTYAIFYTVPLGTPFSPAALSAISAFCVQGDSR